MLAALAMPVRSPNNEGTVPDPLSMDWVKIPADEASDAIIAAMGLGGVDYLFFTSGSEIAFYQEAIAKAKAHGRKAPRLITMTHEHAGLNAALGYAALSGKPAATAAHVDAGTLNYGGAIHTAWHSGLPVLITAGAPPASYPGSLRGARDGGGHIWLQQSYDQNSIVRQYTKWDHRLEFQDNPGLIVSRALQVALTEPRGPVYLSLPREVALLQTSGASFPTVEQLGIPRAVAPNSGDVREIVERLLGARNPFVVVSGSGRNPATVKALIELCELLALPVVDSALPAYHCFPMNHPLYQGCQSLKEADCILVLEAKVPWVPGPDAPHPDAYVAVLDVDPIRLSVPTFEFTAHLRLVADSLLAIRALYESAEGMITAADKDRIAKRAVHWTGRARARRQALEREALHKSTSVPIDPVWLSYQVGNILDDNCVVFDESLGRNETRRYLRCAAPGSYFHNPGTSGGWSPGAAFGAKLAAPDRDVVAMTGDGFYMFGTANAAIWAAAHYGAPFMTVVYQNRSYSTGTHRVASTYPDSYAAKSGFEGGYFDPPIDFAREAEAAGAYGENVRDPAEVGPALGRGLEKIRNGTPAVISVWMSRLLQED